MPVQDPPQTDEFGGILVRRATPQPPQTDEFGGMRVQGTHEPIGYRDGMPVYSIDVYPRPAEPVFEGTDPQGKPVFGIPPAPAQPPLPAGLGGEPEHIARNIDPRTGEYIQTPAIGTVPFLDAPFTGTMRAVEGLDRVRNAQSARDVAGGGSEMIRGGIEAIAPFALPFGMAAAPISTAITLGTGMGLSEGSEATLNALGVPKEYSALASDLIGLFGAGWAHTKMRGLAKLPYLRESNAIQARLQEAVRRAQDPNASPMERAAAKAQVDALMQGLESAEAGQPGGYVPPPRSPAFQGEARDVIEQGKRYGVRLSAGDVTQSPALKNLEVSAEKVPGIGMQTFREKQQIEARQAAGRVRSQFEDALIEAEPSSLTELQEAAEGGDQRARNVLEKMTSAGNDPDRIIQASIGLGDWTTRQTATGLYDRVQDLAQEHNLGDVPLQATGKAIGSSLQQLRPAKLPNKEVIRLLSDIKQSISPKVDAEGNPLLDAEGKPVSPNNTYALIRQLHSDLGDRIREYYQGNNALIGEKGVGYLERVQNALEDDMRNYAKNSNVPEIVEAGRVADEYYKSARVPYKNGMLAAATTSNEPDQIFQQFIKAGKGDRAKNFYSSLDDRGKAAVRFNMVSKAIDDSINPQSGIFSPQKFFTAVEKLDEAYGVFFNAKDKAEIQGFKNLMGHVTRAGQYAENPPTGQRVIPLLIAGGALTAASHAAAHPYMAGSGLALIAAARGLLTTVKGRDLLLRLNGIKEGSPLMESVWQRIGKEMLQFTKRPPEEPPPAGSGGGPANPPGPPAGNAGAGPVAEQTPTLGQRIKQELKRLWEDERGSIRIDLGGEYSKHVPPPEGEPMSPLKSLQPPEIRRGGKLEGSLHYLRRAAEREPGVGGPDNKRTVLRDDKGEFVVGQITPEDWVNRVSQNLSPDEMVKARKWYRELSGFFTEHFGEKEGPKMALAWLSSQQNVSPSGGMTNVLRAMDQLRGMPKEKVAGLAEDKILAALRGEMPEGGYGAKLNDFVDSAMGKSTRTWMGDDPRGGRPAVIDVWANRDVGKIDQKVLDYLTQRFGAKAVKNLKVDGKSIGETDYEYGSRFYNQLVDALNKSGFDGGGWTGDQVQAVGWTAMQKALGATPEFASDLITKNTRRYGYEIHPGEGAPVLQQYPYHELTPDQQTKLTDYVGSRVTDLAAKLTGAKVTNRQVTRGAYLGQPTISVQMDVFASPETFRDFGRAAGYLGQQSEVWHVRPLKSGNSWAYSIRGAKGLDTPEVQQQFWEKLRDRVGADLVPGYSPMGGDVGTGIFIVNPFNRKYLFERAKAGFKNPTTMRPWTAGDKAKVDAGIEAVADEMGLDLDVEYGKVDLGASLHNWARKGKKNGHLQRLVETGRSDLADRLSNHAPEALQWWGEAWNRFAGGAENPSQGLQQNVPKVAGKKPPPGR